MTQPNAPAPNPDVTLSERLAQPVLAVLAEAVERLRFGVVQLTVHDGKVVQLDVTEKHRF